MIKFYSDETQLVLEYAQDQEPSQNYLLTEFYENDDDADHSISIQGIFNFKRKHLMTNIYEIDFDDENRMFDTLWAEFDFGRLEGGYYKINDGVITSKVALYIHRDVKLERRHFIAEKRTSIFRILERVVNSDIYIGGKHPEAIPLLAFEKLIRNFPNSYELRKYVDARISATLNNYVLSVKEAEASYQKYMQRKLKRRHHDIQKDLKAIELFKYEMILEKLRQMLKEENVYREKDWQREIKDIILLLYPKYLAAFDEVVIRDSDDRRKRLDFLLIDSNGYADIIEIKKPFGKAVMTERLHRQNHIPMQELIGTIMQLEKYMYYMSRNGAKIEKSLADKYGDQLPAGLKIKVINPQGIIIMGREENLTSEQKSDFEIVKRKYKNVVDILTYDNLIFRLQATIAQLKKK